jgi:hypothetical protein
MRAASSWRPRRYHVTLLTSIDAQMRFSHCPLWPDGTIEPVEKFKAGFEALDWVKTHSAAWAAQRVGMLSE